MTESNRAEEALKWAETVRRAMDSVQADGCDGNSCKNNTPSHILAAEVIRLRSLAKKMAGALGDLVERVDINGGLGRYESGPPFAMGFARDILKLPEIQALLKAKS